MTGIQLIAVERQRQLEDEWWTNNHDKGELIDAAVTYAMWQSQTDLATLIWPWELVHFNPKGKISNLARAGALIAAEIDRLQLAGELKP